MAFENAQITVRQHWVPQFYLRHFTNASDQGKLYVTDVKRYYNGNGEYSPANGKPDGPPRKAIKDIACLDYLYSDVTGEVVTNELEDGVFQTMEAALAVVFRKIIDGTANLSQNSADRAALALFTASLHFRHPRMVAEILGIPREEAPLGRGLGEIKHRKEFRELQTCAPMLATMLAARDWELLRFEDGSMVTSDTPVFVTEGPDFERGSYESDTSVVLLPINRSLLLTMRGQGLPTFASPDSESSGYLTRHSPIAADIFNRYIVNYSESYVYSSRPLPKELASDVHRRLTQH